MPKKEEYKAAPTPEKKSSKRKRAENIDSEELAAQISNIISPKITKEIHKMLTSKLSHYEHYSKDQIEAFEKTSKDIKSHSDEFKRRCDNYLKNFDRFNELHNTFAGLSLTKKVFIYCCFGLFLVFGIVIGGFAQEKFFVFDTSNGWNQYVLTTHKNSILKCKKEAIEKKKPLKCLIIEQP